MSSSLLSHFKQLKLLKRKLEIIMYQLIDIKLLKFLKHWFVRKCLHFFLSTIFSIIFFDFFFSFILNCNAHNASSFITNLSFDKMFSLDRPLRPEIHLSPSIFVDQQLNGFPRKLLLFCNHGLIKGVFIGQ